MDKPKVDEKQLRIEVNQLTSTLGWFWGLEVQDDGTYKSLLKEFEMAGDGMIDYLIEYFGLPEDWS